MSRPRKPRTPQQKVNDHLQGAHRELVRGVERFAKVDDLIGVLPGHRAEMIRRLESVRDVADEFLAKYGEES